MNRNEQVGKRLVMAAQARYEPYRPFFESYIKAVGTFGVAYASYSKQMREKQETQAHTTADEVELLKKGQLNG